MCDDIHLHFLQWNLSHSSLHEELIQISWLKFLNFEYWLLLWQLTFICLFLKINCNAWEEREWGSIVSSKIVNPCTVCCDIHFLVLFMTLTYVSIAFFLRAFCVEWLFDMSDCTIYKIELKRLIESFQNKLLASCSTILPLTLKCLLQRNLGIA
jgi:hypothetical protein